MANWRLGPSFPSTAVMPAPNTRSRRRLKRGVMNESADATLYYHEFAQKWQWFFAWQKISLANVNTILAEFNRSRTLAMVDFDASSFTVIAEPESFELEEAPGGTQPLHNLKIVLRQV